MVKCRHCGGEELRKDWAVKGKHTTRENEQRYSMNKSVFGIN